jgi:Putative amidoligase enzyme
MAEEQAASGYDVPPRATNQEGAIRKVGLEVELAGVPVEEVLTLVKSCFGGEIELAQRSHGAVLGTPWGKFKVEYDWRALQKRSYLKPLEAIGVEADSATAEFIEESVLQVAGEIVPIEVVTPPIPWPALHELDPLWEALRAAGAQDTHSSVLHAFGLHLNPEAPDREPASVLAHLRAFLLLDDWIIDDAEIDIARRIAPFIRPFPESYRRRVLVPDYAPDAAQLVADYVAASPTRNRGLDLLPLFRAFYGDSFLAQVEEAELVQSRPTFHYRLPNCELSTPGWSPRSDWNRWVALEKLADDRELLTELSRAYLETFDWPLRLQSIGWIDVLRERLRLPGEVRDRRALGA